MDLTALDEAILDELDEGARTQGFLVDATGEPRYKVHERLKLLTAVGYVENIHENTALYELRADPRDEDDN
ncbi:ArsR family transcriptional regulator [Haladaptatus sp. AB643]|uniref:ArsR family transcriptional regulator n=1 Tax=Haladaptatus sp. AB643 TaxID=2934174 RepID=UPI00209C2527|nr:ArsR family transcriptional regulator [Haladaptatus sp. AB643]MCO8242964.1 ArsR family transcriptional regulator [Haladaptatus sp. AB643]